MHHAVLRDSLCKLETKTKPALAATSIVNTVLTAEVFYGIGADTNREAALFCEETQKNKIDMRFKPRYLLIAVARSKLPRPCCLEAPRHLHPGVLPPLPEHLGSSSFPVGSTLSAIQTFGEGQGSMGRPRL
jgi:hypothetical protein